MLNPNRRHPLYRIIKTILETQKKANEHLCQDLNRIEQKIQPSTKGFDYKQQLRQLKYSNRSFWISLFVGAISIIGVFISCWLALISYNLSVAVSKNDTSIHRLDSLISTMAQVSKKQDTEINQIQTQNTYIRGIDRPNIIVTSVKFDAVDGNQSIFSHHIYYENFGKRTAYKVKIGTYFFRVRADSLECFGSQSTENFFKGEDNPLQGGGKGQLKIDTLRVSTGDFLNSYEVILLSYFDKKTNKTFKEAVQFRNKESVGTLMMITKRERILIEQAVKRNKIHL
jgi:hypothetical protein